MNRWNKYCQWMIAELEWNRVPTNLADRIKAYRVLRLLECFLTAICTIVAWVAGVSILQHITTHLMWEASLWNVLMTLMMVTLNIVAAFMVPVWLWSKWRIPCSRFVRIRLLEGAQIVGDGEEYMSFLGRVHPLCSAAAENNRWRRDEEWEGRV